MSYRDYDNAPDALRTLWTVFCICALYAATVVGCAMSYDGPEVVKIPPEDREADPAL